MRIMKNHEVSDRKREIEKTLVEDWIDRGDIYEERSIIMLYLSAEMQMVFRDMHIAVEPVK